jgi:hypothetical protein
MLTIVRRSGDDMAFSDQRVGQFRRLHETVAPSSVPPRSITMIWGVGYDLDV